jgi:hypothetical protein
MISSITMIKQVFMSFLKAKKDGGLYGRTFDIS